MIRSQCFDSAVDKASPAPASRVVPFIQSVQCETFSDTPLWAVLSTAWMNTQLNMGTTIRAREILHPLEANRAWELNTLAVSSCIHLGEV